MAQSQAVDGDISIRMIGVPGMAMQHADLETDYGQPARIWRVPVRPGSQALS
jgi:hypothetical protein